MISRDEILAKAAQLAKTEPLAELSVMGLAREFGVTPALIHYYAGSRDELISGVTNLYFKARVESFPPLSGNWRTDIERHARDVFELMTEYGGVVRYMMSYNRARLFHDVGPGEIDYGMVFLDRMAQIFRDAGFTPQQTAMGYHLLAQYMMAAAHAHVSRQLPADHGKFILSRIEATPLDQYPSAHFMAEAFAHVDSATAFAAGLKLLLDGMESWRAPRSARAGSGSTARTRSGRS